MQHHSPRLITPTRVHLQRLLAFTLVEMLLVIAVISILASMVISSFSDAAQTSREVVVRQQLAVWQGALNNWVNRKLGRVDTAIVSSGAPVTLEALTNYYNNTLNTSAKRFTMITGKDMDDATADTEGYLDAMTGQHYIDMAKKYGPADLSLIKSDAMVQTGRWLTLPNWVSGSYPTVNLNPGSSGSN
jgi:prepilin-type N-terminal cleavage/methylation domain-containing protein